MPSLVEAADFGHQALSEPMRLIALGLVSSGVSRLAFLHREPWKLKDPQWAARDSQCVDSRVTVEAAATAEELAQDRSRILVQLLKDVRWAFNYRSPDIREMVYETATHRSSLQDWAHVGEV